MVALVEKIARREGIGDLLADGVKRAAEKLGRGADSLAMHVGGQELPMHDPRYEPVVGVSYQVDPTPARHVTCLSGLYENDLMQEIIISTLNVSKYIFYNPYITISTWKWLMIIP